MKDVNIQLLEYAIPPPEKIWTTSLPAAFLKHGQLYFSKASNSISYNLRTKEEEEEWGGGHPSY